MKERGINSKRDNRGRNNLARDNREAFRNRGMM
jgi:hypothetical protein